MGDGADFFVNNDPRMTVREKRARFLAPSRVAPQEDSCPSSVAGMGFLFFQEGLHDEKDPRKTMAAVGVQQQGKKPVCHEHRKEKKS
jgi:hypothetical protein